MGSLHQTQLGIATQVSVIKVKVTVTKIEIQLSHQYLVESLKTWFSSHCGVSCIGLNKENFKQHLLLNRLVMGI